MLSKQYIWFHMVSTVRSAHLHFKLRWAGFCFLLSGVALFLYFLAKLFAGGSIVYTIFSFVSCGLSLGAFGINHDTAIAYVLRAQSEGVLLSNHPMLNQELKEDLDRDRAETMLLKPHSILSYLIPCIAFALQGYLWSVVFNL